MNTLSEQLTELYRPLWDKLLKQLEIQGKITQRPFVLSVARHKDDYCNYISKYEDWYTKADVKVMIFGQEPHGWVKTEDLGDSQRAYESFFEENYVVTAQGGFWSHDKIAPGNHFFRWGCNAMMGAGIEEQILKPYYPTKRVAMLWNNISKLSTIDGGPVDTDTHVIERQYIHVIPQEVKILRPDIVVFLTGPGENSYYRYILENFNLTDEPSPIGNIPAHDLVKLPLDGVKLAYKTYHPNVRVSKGVNPESFNWQFYQAILDDIKAHFDELIK